MSIDVPRVLLNSGGIRSKSAQVRPIPTKCGPCWLASPKKWSKCVKPRSKLDRTRPTPDQIWKARRKGGVRGVFDEANSPLDALTTHASDRIEHPASKDDIWPKDTHHVVQPCPDPIMYNAPHGSNTARIWPNSAIGPSQPKFGLHRPKFVRSYSNVGEDQSKLGRAPQNSVNFHADGNPNLSKHRPLGADVGKIWSKSRQSWPKSSRLAQAYRLEPNSVQLCAEIRPTFGKRQSLGGVEIGPSCSTLGRSRPRLAQISKTGLDPTGVMQKPVKFD